MINLIYYAILIPFLFKIPTTIHPVVSSNPLDIRNFAPYYHHCIHNNAAIQDIYHSKPRHPPGCWLNYTSMFWSNRRLEPQILVSNRATMQFKSQKSLYPSSYPSLYTFLYQQNQHRHNIINTITRNRRVFY